MGGHSRGARRVSPSWALLRYSAKIAKQILILGQDARRDSCAGFSLGGRSNDTR